MTPLDSTPIYPTNPVILHPLNDLWPVKCKSPIWYLCLEPELCTSSPKHHMITIKSLSSVYQPMLIISNKIVNPQTIVINTKTRIRGLDAFISPSLASALWALLDSRQAHLPRPIPDGIGQWIIGHSVAWRRVLYGSGWRLQQDARIFRDLTRPSFL